MSGELAAEITKHVDLSGAWKQEQDKLWRSQQKTQYCAQPLRNPDGVKWPWGIVQEVRVSVIHATKIYRSFLLTEILFLTWKDLFHPSQRGNPVPTLPAKAERQYCGSPNLCSKAQGKGSVWLVSQYTVKLFFWVWYWGFLKGALWKNYNRLQFKLRHKNNSEGGITNCFAHGRKDYDSKSFCKRHTQCWCDGDLNSVKFVTHVIVSWNVTCSEYCRSGPNFDRCDICRIVIYMKLFIRRPAYDSYHK